jgi:predicted dehydrogenase
MAKRVLVVGLGNMGMRHALAYTPIPGFEVVGVCETRVADRKLPPGATMQAKSRTAGPASRRDCRRMLAAGRVDFRVPVQRGWPAI